MKFLYDNFDLLFDEARSVDAFKKLILDMAVRGKLVPQDPNDEQMSVKSGDIHSKLKDLHAEAVPYVLPGKWQWIGIKDLFKLISTKGKHVKTSNYKIDGNYPIVSQSKDFISGYSNDEEKLIRITKPIVVFGDHTREVKYIDFNFIVGAEGTKLIDVIKDLHPKYFYYVLKEINLEARDYGRHFKLLSSTLFPLPPLNEQTRIVQKIDEIFEMIPQLEEAFEKRTKYNRQLNHTSLNRLTDAKSRDVFVSSMQFVTNNFDSLYDIIENVKELRQAILTMAVQGKLVPQDPNDEPASVLLDKIQKEKERLIKEGVLNKEKPLPPIKQDEVPFNSPDGWEWVRLGNITNYGQNKYFKSSLLKDSDWLLELEDIEKDNSRLIKKVLFKDRKSKSNKFSFKESDVLYGKLRPYLNKVIVADSDGFCSSEIIPIRTYGLIQPKYLMYSMKNKSIIDYINNCTYGTKMPRLGTADARKALISLPPFEEQKRIVDKVDKVLLFCNELESHLISSENVYEHLLTALLNEAISKAS